MDGELLASSLLEGPFSITGRRCLGAREVVDLSQASLGLRQSWLEALQEEKAEVIDERALELLQHKARQSDFESAAFNFKKSFLTDDEMELLCSSARFCIAMSEVADFCINVNEVGDRGMCALARVGTMLPFRDLADFFAIDNHIGDDGIKALAQAASEGALPSLKLMYLYSNCIGDAGFTALAEAAALGAFAPNGLETLLVMDNDISDKGVLSLERPMRLGKLRRLREFGVGNSMADRGLQVFLDASLRGELPHLRELHLTHNPLTDLGLNELLKSPLQLSHLGLEGTRTSGSAQDFREPITGRGAAAADAPSSTCWRGPARLRKRMAEKDAACSAARKLWLGAKFGAN
ncbi:unnamed protein product [Effrenium voratum]|uniref:Uncharacterized protein n=1 Tax=Effrenium voratum TaxID=2562239 RepID=A0AA36MKC3_9DINO|nr:unnamed protein product [Effrenium voratum]